MATKVESDKDASWGPWLQYAAALFVGGLLTFLFQNYYIHERHREQFERQRQWEAQLEQKRQALQHFNLESARYVGAMDDAFNIAFKGAAYPPLTKGESSAGGERLSSYGQAMLAQWRGERRPRLDAVLMDLNNGFQDRKDTLEKIDALRCLLRKIDNAFEDTANAPNPASKWSEYKEGAYGELKKELHKLRLELSDLAAKQAYVPAFIQ